jgi:hypothetical protein
VFDVGDTRLWGEVRLPLVPEDADHRAHLRERPRRRFLDGLEHRQRTIGGGGGHGSSGLGLDRDGRDVVADRVVQLACEVVAEPELGLLDVAEAGGGVPASCRP